jgi:hypothetical protein
MVSKSLRHFIGNVQTKAPKAQSVERMAPFFETASHIKASTRKGWKCHVALEHDSDRVSKLVIELVERYDAFTMRRYAHGLETLASIKDSRLRTYTFQKWMREYGRKLPTSTPQVREDALAWYAMHGNERVRMLRKQHARILLPNGNVILRTA